MTYRERRLAKAERLRGWAEKREAKATQAQATATETAEMIPFGQPILVGHHSERRHRNQLEKINRNMRASIDNSNTAERMRQKADNIESAAGEAIYSDDPDAILRLSEKIDRAESVRAAIVAFNKTARKGAADYSLIEGQLATTYDDLCKYGGVKRGDPFSSYVTSNMSGNIGRMKKRLEALKRRAA